MIPKVMLIGRAGVTARVARIMKETTISEVVAY